MSNMPAWERYIGLPLLKVHDAIYRKTNGRIG
ncbi:MAG: Nitroreductase, partial [Mycobacterium sp.]|nr:Nitroreductase [Mycobacterium sp.]